MMVRQVLRTRSVVAAFRPLVAGCLGKLATSRGALTWTSSCRRA